MTPGEKSTHFSNEYHRFQTFKNQLQSKFQSLEDQQTDFIKKATKSIKEAKNKPRTVIQTSQHSLVRAKQSIRI